MESWEILFAVGNVLYTEARGHEFSIVRVDAAGVRVHLPRRNHGAGQEVELRSDLLRPLLINITDVERRITAGERIIDVLHDYWQQAGVTGDPQNESQYWAVVREHARRFAAVRTLVGG